MANRLASSEPETAPGVSEIEQIVEIFELLENWEQRYQYLVELGLALPALPDALKTQDNWVRPCMSKVYVCAERLAGDSELIRFRGDCDTAIIKGILALLIELFSNRTLSEIISLDADELFRRLQLEEHLSPSRHVGIYAIIDHMRASARQFSEC